MISKLAKNTLLPLSVCCLLPACAFFGDKPPEYVETDPGRTLQVPQDLDSLVYVRPVEIVVPPMRIPAGDELNPGPPRAASTGGKGDANAFIAWSADGAFLQVNDTVDSVVRRLGYAIERSGMRLLLRDPGGAHEFEYVHLRIDERSFWQKMLFWRGNDGPDYSGSYRTRVRDESGQARVYLEYTTGAPAPTNATEYILGIFMERLG